TIYKPQENIKPEWYDEVRKNVTIEEWENAVRDIKNNSALGQSGI
ncbi:26919_t:CDS:1, partial [Gigaspora margarita]